MMGEIGMMRETEMTRETRMTADGFSVWGQSAALARYSNMKEVTGCSKRKRTRPIWRVRKIRC